MIVVISTTKVTTGDISRHREVEDEDPSPFLYHQHSPGNRQAGAAVNLRIKPVQILIFSISLLLFLSIRFDNLYK